MAEATSIMDCEIVSTRMFHMPREAIFAAFRDPVQLKEWWGPNGFKNTIETFDFQKDGIWKFTMHGPDGTDYHNVSTFAEIAEPVRIIFDHDKPIHRFRMTMTFDEQDGSTKVRWAMLFENIEECEKVKAFVPNANEQNFDRLERHLAKVTGKSISTSISDREVRVMRWYDAPRDLVFSAWTDPEHLKHWYGPDGFTITTSQFDFRPGGEWRFTMHGPDGRDYPNWITYLDISKPERIRVSHGGNVDGEPVDFEQTMTFTEEAGKTCLTMRALFVTAAMRDKAVREYGAIDGGKQTLGRLAEYLAKKK